MEKNKDERKGIVCLRKKRKFLFDDKIIGI